MNFEILPKEVQWPTGDALRQVPRQLYDMARMPCVSGCVDGTMIPILAPTENEPHFVDRHGRHSINAMLVGGPGYRFYYCSANWPGSVNDCRVLKNSSLLRKFASGWRPFTNAILLGDSIYPCKEWLIPPIPEALIKSDQEKSFNASHMSTRRMIESSIGILKNKFPCLNFNRVKSPKYACEIIKACTALHNVALKYKAPIIPDPPPRVPVLNSLGLESEASTDSDNIEEILMEQNGNMSSTLLGKRKRRQLVNCF